MEMAMPTRVAQHVADERSEASERLDHVSSPVPTFRGHKLVSRCRRRQYGQLANVQVDGVEGVSLDVTMGQGDGTVALADHQIFKGFHGCVHRQVVVHPGTGLDFQNDVVKNGPCRAQGFKNMGLKALSVNLCCCKRGILREGPKEQLASVDGLNGNKVACVHLLVTMP